MNLPSGDNAFIAIVAIGILGWTTWFLDRAIGRLEKNVSMRSTPDCEPCTHEPNLSTSLPSWSSPASSTWTKDASSESMSETSRTPAPDSGSGSGRVEMPPPSPSNIVTLTPSPFRKLKNVEDQ